MKIAYMWMKDYEVLGGKGLNFHPKFEFSYDIERNTLKCDKHICFSYGNIADENETISLIVGDNGSGKTTILFLLMYMFSYTNTLKGNSYISSFVCVILDEDNTIYYFSNIEGLEKGDLKMQEILVNKDDNYSNRGEEEMKDVGFIFHSNLLDRNRYGYSYSLAGVKDISFNEMLIKDKYSCGICQSGFQTDMQMHLNQEVRRELDFVFSDFYKKHCKKIGIKCSNDIDVVFIAEQYFDDICLNIDKSSLVSDSAKKEIVDLGKRIIARFNELYENGTYAKILGVNDFLHKIRKSIMQIKVCDIFAWPVGKGINEERQNMIQNMQKFVAEKSSIDYIEYFREFINIITPANEKVQENADKLLSFMFGKSEIISGTIFTGYSIHIKDRDVFSDFYKLYKAVSPYNDYLAFSWRGLSSGEYNLLSLYSRFYGLRNDDDISNSKSLVIILDEADLLFHPKWQQSYILNITSFIKQLFKNKSYQFMIATHSPIMISDVFGGSVNFLSSSDGATISNTFAMNIYDIYQHAMFLDSGEYGIIGRYAYEKINTIYKKLDEWESNEQSKSEFLCNKAYIGYVIDNIGDELTKKLLSRKYNYVKDKYDHVKDKYDHENEVDELINRIKKLTEEEQFKLAQELHLYMED